MMRSKRIASVLVLCCAAASTAYKITKYDPLVKTKSGLVRGYRQDVFGRSIDAFLGVPFAEPPVGVLRFKPPVPTKPWFREFRALFLPPSCIQPSVYFNKVINITGEERSEDCLYLNVWAPSPDSTGVTEGPKAVMLFFHGGAFFFGSSNWYFYDGSNLAALGDVVVVTANYRLGPFGFMNAGTANSPGNQGLYDQNLAMRWVRDNIRYFGGDEEQVTLFGQSAGAISIGYHLASPLSKGLFKRVIMQSGSPYWTVGNSVLDDTDRFTKAAVKLNCAKRGMEVTVNFESVLKCLQEKNATEILSALETRSGRVQLTYHPGHGDELVPEEISKAIRKGFANDADLLIGSVKDEGSVFIEYYLSTVMDFMNIHNIQKGSLEVYFMLLFRFLHQPKVQEIRDFYLENTSNDPKSFLGRASTAMGDFAFLCPLMYFAEDYAKRNNSVYFYEFAHRPSYSWNAEWAGVAHFEEIPFVFGYTLNNDMFNITQEERDFTLFVMYTWTHFAKTGKVPEVNGKTWPEFKASDPSYAELNVPTSHIKSPLSEERCEFWRSRILNLRMAP